MRTVGFLLAAVFLVNGCAIISHGRFEAISEEQVDALKIGVSTKEEVIALLGKPQQIMRKPNEVEVLVYSHGFERNIAIPFLLSIGRAAGSGQNLKVIFKKGIVVDYEYITDDRQITQ